MLRPPSTRADEPVPHRQDVSDREAEAAAAQSGTDGVPAATDTLYILAPSGSGNGFTTDTAAGAAAARGGAQGGWMLLALHGQRQRWSMPLFSRGAAIAAPPRVAQAVAVRVLNDLGVHVRAWHAAGSADQPKYRGRARGATRTPPHAGRPPPDAPDRVPDLPTTGEPIRVGELHIADLAIGLAGGTVLLARWEVARGRCPRSHPRLVASGDRHPARPARVIPTTRCTPACVTGHLPSRRSPSSPVAQRASTLR